MRKKIAVFTGAGISAESGIETFRSGDGALWANYKVEDVATPQGWKKDPEMVTEFYNERRMQLADVEPNAAHEALANLERIADVEIFTQNIDDLHERGGSTFVHHLHGELSKVRSTSNPNEIYDWGYKAVDLEEDRGENNARLRPHVVWFEEMPDVRAVKRAYEFIYECDVLLIIGTSLQISYTLDMLLQVSNGAKVYFIDPEPVGYLDRYHSLDMMPEVTYVKKKATEGVKEVVEQLMAEDAS